MTEIEKKILGSGEPADETLLRELEKCCTGLVYVSEQDSPIMPFVIEEKLAAVDKLLVALAIDPQANRVEVSFESFFSPLTRQGSDAAQVERSDRFKRLQELLMARLDNLSVVKVGHIRIDIIVFGYEGGGRIAGVKTTAIET